jgi:trigger factor
MQGLDLNTYFKYTGMTLDTMRDQMRPQAESFVKTRLALEKIAELENIAASEEEIEAEYNRLAEAYQMEADAVKGMIPAESVAEDLKVKAAMDLVKANAVAPAAEKKPARKPRAKKAKVEEEAPAVEETPAE